MVRRGEEGRVSFSVEPIRGMSEPLTLQNRKAPSRVASMQNAGLGHWAQAIEVSRLAPWVRVGAQSRTDSTAGPCSGRR